MPTKTSQTLFVIFTASLTACANQEVPQKADITDVALELAASGKTDSPEQGTKASQDYYKARRDFRKCAAPTCGGWFLSKLNHMNMQCPDGGVEQECYVPEVSLPWGVPLEDGDIVHGWFGTQDAFGNDILEADFAYESLLENPWPYGSHNLVFNSGIVCIQAPCPSTSLRYLNSNLLWSDANYFYWADTAEENLALELALQNEYANDLGAPGGGAITFGEFWYWGWGYHYSVYNVFTQKKAQTPACVIYDDTQRSTAWSFSARAEAEVFAASYGQNISIVDGHCGSQGIECPQTNEPVHGGIDANNFSCVVYNNACLFRAAIISAAGSQKATGTWRNGGTCDEE